MMPCQLVRRDGCLRRQPALGGGLRQPTKEPPNAADLGKGTYRCEVFRRAFPQAARGRSK
jgi:hypothetical protein